MTEQAFPSMALAAYAEALIDGRRVIVFGDSTSGLAELLLQRGARLVHVYDGDLGRLSEATARGASNEVSYAPLGQSGIAVRDGAFDFGIIENLAAQDDPRGLIRRLRRALAARGVAIVATPNVEASRPLLRDGETVNDGPTYYDLYDAVTAEFDEVKMLGQLPFVGYAVADFGAEGDTDFSLDTGLLQSGAEEPDWFLALVSHFPVSNDAFSVIQVPRGDVAEASTSSARLAAESEELRRQNVQLQAELERLRKSARQTQTHGDADELLTGVRKELEQRDAWIAELEERLAKAEQQTKAANASTRELEETLHETKQAQAMRDQAAHEALLAKTKELEAALQKRTEVPKVPAEPKPSVDRQELETLQAEVIRLEEQLRARGKECQRKEQELATAEKTGMELLAEIEALKEAGSDHGGEVEELREAVRRLQAVETRRVADLTAAQWTIEQLQRRIGSNAPSEDPNSMKPS